MDSMLEDELGPASLLKMKNHSGVEIVEENLPDFDESKDTINSILNTSNIATHACEKDHLIMSSSSENSKKLNKKYQYSDTSSDSGSYGNSKESRQIKHYGDNGNVKRRKRRKRPSDPKSKAMKQKAADIEKALRRSYNNHSASSLSDSNNRESDAVLNQITRKSLRDLAITEYGLLNDELRRRAWPQLVGVNMLTETCVLPTQEEVEAHKSYRQVVMDVDRSLKRFPPGIAEEERPDLQDQLTRLIVRVLMKHPQLNYYQGYHDVAITFLLVVGEELGFHIVERLSAGKQLREFMTPTMDRTTYLLHFMYPVIKQECSELYEYLEESEVGTIFALPWLITWFSHVLPNYKDVVRLFDFFLAHSQSPMMPVYLATAIVLHRQNEILMSGPENCDMAYVHALLSRIPVSDTFPIEKLLVKAQYLHEKYPPSSVEKEVKARLKKLDDELKMIQQRRNDVKKRMEKAFNRDSEDGSDDGRYKNFFTKSGKILVIAAPIIIGVVVWRYFSHVKDSFPM